MQTLKFQFESHIQILGSDLVGLEIDEYKPLNSDVALMRVRLVGEHEIAGQLEPLRSSWLPVEGDDDAAISAAVKRVIGVGGRVVRE